MKLLGLIGGTSWHSTIAYYRLINEGVGQVIGEAENPELLIHSINIALMRAQDGERIRAKYLDVARRLEANGAEALVICANTPHMVYDYVQPQIGIPILHIADATGREAARRGLKKLGLLGNRPTMTGEFIPGPLREKYGIETLLPEGEDLARAHDFVSRELTQGRFTEEARQFFFGQIERLQARGADGIILGCTELPLLIRPEEVAVPLLATTDLHAQMAVEFILEQ